MSHSAPHCSIHPDHVLLHLRPPSPAPGEGRHLCGSTGGQHGWRGAVGLLLSRKTTYSSQSCSAHEFWRCLGFLEVGEGQFGSCQGSQLGLLSARPHLAKSKCPVTTNQPHPLMPLTSHTKSLILCCYLGISRCSLCCQLSRKIEIASFVTGAMPRNTSGSRVLAVFVLCSQWETIC